MELISKDDESWQGSIHIPQLEQEWIAPALLALEEGQLKQIELHGFGDERAISIAMTSFDRFRFWRKPRRLESL